MIVLIDNYDSFTYNLVQRLGELDPNIDLQVHRNDQITVAEILKQKPDGIVISPGPGNPQQSGICLDLIKQAVELEYQYAVDCLPNGILGLTAPMFRDYVQYIADRRLERIGLKAIYGSKNPFPWMSETIDLQKEKNFFETRVTEYQTAASLNW